MRKLNAGGPSANNGGRLVFLTTSALQVSQMISGTYLRTIQAGKKAKKDVYIVRLTSPLEYRGELIQVGADVGINTDGLLTKHMPGIPAGTEIQLVYLGKKELKNGNTPHSWDIYADVPESLPA